MLKYFYILLSSFFVINSALASPLSTELRLKMIKQEDSFRNSSGFESASPGTLNYTIASIIKIFLGFLGIIFIVLIIWAGYNWMTAGGNEEKVTKAKKTLYQAIIGLIIIVSAYAITYFVFSALDKSTSTI